MFVRFCPGNLKILQAYNHCAAELVCKILPRKSYNLTNSVQATMFVRFCPGRFTILQMYKQSAADRICKILARKTILQSCKKCAADRMSKIATQGSYNFTNFCVVAIDY